MNLINIEILLDTSQALKYFVSLKAPTNILTKMWTYMLEIPIMKAYHNKSNTKNIKINQTSYLP